MKSIRKTARTWGATVAALASLGLLVSAAGPASAAPANLNLWQCDSTPSQYRVIKVAACIQTDATWSGGNKVARWGVEIENTYSQSRTVTYLEGRSAKDSWGHEVNLGYTPPVRKFTLAPREKRFIEFRPEYRPVNNASNCYLAQGVAQYAGNTLPLTDTYTCKSRTGNR